jgi:hypothetical protein
MTKIEKVLYTSKTHTSGGRDGKSGSADGRLDITFVARRLGQRHKFRAIICRRMVGLFHRCHETCRRQNADRPSGRPGGRCRSGSRHDG